MIHLSAISSPNKPFIVSTWILISPNDIKHHLKNQIQQNTFLKEMYIMEIVLESSYLSRHPMKGSLSKSWILDSTPWIPDAGYWISVFVCGTWDSAFQSLVRFPIRWAVFWLPKPRIPESTNKNFPDFGIRIPSFVLVTIVAGEFSLSLAIYACSCMVSFLMRLNVIFFFSDTKAEF